MRRPSPLPEPFNSGPFAFHAADDAGISRRRLRALDLATPFRGVRTAHAPASILEWCEAFAVQMPVDQHFSHSTAALLHGLPLPRRLEAATPLHISAIRPSRPPRMAGVVGHEAHPHSELTQTNGFRVLAPIDTWVQLGGLLRLDEMIVAGDRLVKWRDPLTTSDALERRIRRLAGRQGVTAARAALPWLRSGSASPQETLLRLRVIRAGLPEPELNAPIVIRGGRVVHGDLVFRGEKTVGEYDGEQHRTDRQQYRTDVDRLNDLAEAGWLVIRIHADSRDAVARIARVLRSRR